MDIKVDFNNITGVIKPMHGLACKDSQRRKRSGTWRNQIWLWKRLS